MRGSGPFAPPHLLTRQLNRAVDGPLQRHVMQRHAAVVGYELELQESSNATFHERNRGGWLHEQRGT